MRETSFKQLLRESLNNTRTASRRRYVGILREEAVPADFIKFDNVNKFKETLLVSYDRVMDQLSYSGDIMDEASLELAESILDKINYVLDGKYGIDETNFESNYNILKEYASRVPKSVDKLESMVSNFDDGTDIPAPNTKVEQLITKHQRYGDAYRRGLELSKKLVKDALPIFRANSSSYRAIEDAFAYDLFSDYSVGDNTLKHIARDYR